MIFVFGSNLAGRHGKGAALFARKNYGAKLGVGRGRTGNAYAIPTKDADLRPLALLQIEREVNDFLSYAIAHMDEKFLVTKIGCGLAGYTNEQIAPFFHDAPVNCLIDEEWQKIIGDFDNSL
jgi:hypothetical protein